MTGRSYTRPVRVMPSVADAEELARELLDPLANRWAHVQAVAARADGPAMFGFASAISGRAAQLPPI